MDFYSIIVLTAVVVAAYLAWTRFFKRKPEVEAEAVAPYKVETPAPVVAPVVETPAPVVAPVVAEVAPVVAPAAPVVAEVAKAPELKVVTGQAKKPAARKPAAKKPTAKKPAARKPAAKKPTPAK